MNIRYPPEKEFLIPPDTVVQYEADPEEPWVYSWIGFRGLYARTLMERARLTSAEPVYRIPKDKKHSLGSFYEQLLETSTQPAGDIHAQGILYHIMYELTLALAFGRTRSRPFPLQRNAYSAGDRIYRE